MKLDLKRYKKEEIKKLLLDKNFLIICNSFPVTSEKWREITQVLLKLNVKLKKTTNSYFKKSTIDTKFCKLPVILNGSILLLKVNNTESLNLSEILSQLKKYSNVISILALKINNKIYSFNQISNLKSLNYKDNVKLLYSNLKNSKKLLSVKLLKYIVNNK